MLAVEIDALEVPARGRGEKQWRSGEREYSSHCRMAHTWQTSARSHPIALGLAVAACGGGASPEVDLGTLRTAMARVQVQEGWVQVSTSMGGRHTIRQQGCRVCRSRWSRERYAASSPSAEDVRVLDAQSGQSSHHTRRSSRQQQPPRRKHPPAQTSRHVVGLMLARGRGRCARGPRAGMPFKEGEFDVKVGLRARKWVTPRGGRECP
jgi:hypothetical protein